MTKLRTVKNRMMFLTGFYGVHNSHLFLTNARHPHDRVFDVLAYTRKE